MKHTESDYNSINIEAFLQELYNCFAVRYAVLKQEKDFVNNNFPNHLDQEKIIIILNDIIKSNNIFYLIKDKNILKSTLELIKDVRSISDNKELLSSSNELILVINELLGLDEDSLLWGQNLYLLLEAQIRRIPSDISPFLHNAIKEFIDTDYMLVEHLVKGKPLQTTYPLNIISSINAILYMYEFTPDIYDKELTDKLSIILEEQKQIVKENKVLVGNIFDRIYQKKMLTKYIYETENNIFEIDENKKNYVKKI